MKKKALFIGRFQPFHNGHFLFLKDIFKLYDEIIIGIGSSQYSNTLDNPFSYDERRMMIERSFDDLKISNYRVVAIPDIHNPPKWVDHVVSIVSDFNVVLTNNSFTKKLFLEKGYDVTKTSLIKRDIYSGKNIRSCIIKDEPWEDLVPSSVFDMINEIDGVKRLKSLL